MPDQISKPTISDVVTRLQAIRWTDKDRGPAMVAVADGIQEIQRLRSVIATIKEAVRDV